MKKPQAISLAALFLSTAPVYQVGDSIRANFLDFLSPGQSMAWRVFHHFHLLTRILGGV
jgi:hypothetical protein